jgi:uncharacterized protein YjbI with pentapeptide repeats
MMLKGKTCNKPDLCSGRLPVTYRKMATAGNNPQFTSRQVFSQIVQSRTSSIVVPVSLPFLESNYFNIGYITGNYLSISDAEQIYLNQIDAAQTYLKLVDASNTYLKQSDANQTYLKQLDASNNYLRKSEATSTYLSQATATTNYLTRADATTSYGSYSNTQSLLNKTTNISYSSVTNYTSINGNIYLGETSNIVATPNIYINGNIVIGNQPGSTICKKIIIGEEDTIQGSGCKDISIVTATGGNCNIGNINNNIRIYGNIELAGVNTGNALSNIKFNGNIAINELILKTPSSDISIDTTLYFPCYHTYSIRGSGAYTITLPIISGIHIGSTITFRVTSGNNTGTITFAGGENQVIYDLNGDSDTYYYLLSGSNVITFTAYPITSNSYGWFILYDSGTQGSGSGSGSGSEGNYLSLTDAENIYLSIVNANNVYLKKTDASSTYLKQTDASSTYLKQTDASSTYLKQTDASGIYLKQTDASITYLNKTDASSTYLQQTDASNTYLNQIDASSTYLKQTDANTTYLNKTDASSTYLNKTDATSTYLSQIYAISAYLNKIDASNIYLRQTDATNTYLSQINATSIYLNKTDASSTYLKQTDANTTYLKKSDAVAQYGTYTDTQTSLTKTTNISFIGSDSNKTSIVGNVFMGGENKNVELSGILQLNQLIYGTPDSLIDSNTVLTFPCYNAYALKGGIGYPITITLPNITSSSVGVLIVFRVTVDSNSGYTFNVSGGQKIVNSVGTSTDEYPFNTGVTVKFQSFPASVSLPRVYKWFLV